jgi:hypothetical protein
MAGVLQNIDPPPPSPPGECAFGAGGGHTRWAERGVGGGGQYFGRRQAQLCTLRMSVLCGIDITFPRECWCWQEMSSSLFYKR